MGLALLFVFTGYVFATIVVLIIVVKLVKQNKWKWISGILVISTSILIPTWDIPIGRINFNYLCENEAGQFIYKQVSLGEEYFLKPGERNTRFQENSKLAYAKGGELNLEKLEKDFGIDTEFDRNYSRWGYIFMRETKITSKQSNNILSRAVSFYYRGGWLTATLMDNRAGTQVCPNNGLPGSKKYIHATIINKTFQDGNLGNSVFLEGEDEYAKHY